MSLSDVAFLPDRVLAKVDQDPDGHLLWTATQNAQGYGQVWTGTRLVPVHRWVCEQVHGPAPSSKHVAGHLCHDQGLHECRTATRLVPCWHRLCLEPSHVGWMTHRQNLLASPRTGAYRMQSRARQERILRGEE